MPLHPTASDLALRLGLTLVAGFLIGLNREEHGAPAGLRTTILVCVAASLAMIQANLLLSVLGHDQASFSVMDVMRLPLGILSGMGFIGAGAILRRDRLVRGITTAATLWYVTVVGLCLGGGQLRLGVAATLIGIFTLTVLKRIERGFQWDRQASLVLEWVGDDSFEEALIGEFRAARIRVRSYSRSRCGGRQRAAFTLVWRERRSESLPPAPISRVLDDPRFEVASWQPDGFAPVDPWPGRR